LYSVREGYRTMSPQPQPAGLSPTLHTALTQPGGVAEKSPVGTTCVPKVCLVFALYYSSSICLPAISYFFPDPAFIRVGVVKPRTRVARSFHYRGFGPSRQGHVGYCGACGAAPVKRTEDRHIDHRRRWSAWLSLSRISV
jgi:hypothetical protein